MLVAGEKRHQHATFAFKGRLTIKGKTQKELYQMNPEKVSRQELIDRIEASRNVNFRLFVASLDGFIAIAKGELVQALKFWIGPDVCREFTVMVTPKTEYVWAKEVWHIQGVWQPSIYIF